jgi:sugar lactone lactonase YvrE
LNGTVTTIAGSGVAGYADGTGTSAQFNQPVGVTLDASGNLYVMDYVGSRIRKITPSGEVSTIAGSGTIGYADGVGTTAQFNYPLHIALDTLGNLFVTDRLNYRIRAINVCGAAGTLPGAAAYSGTTFLEATANNGSISTTQTITLGGASWANTIANGAALTAGTHFTATGVPAGLTLTVTRLSATQASISFTGVALAHAVANNTSATLTFLNAAVASGDALAVMGLTPKMLSIAFQNPTTAVVANVGYAPYHIARDAQGNFFVPQQGTRTVYKFAPQSNGPIQVVTGFTSTALLTGGIAIDSIGNIYVATLANSIEKLTSGASISTTYYSSTLLSTPYGLDVDKQGNLYVASYDNASIVQVQSPTVANVVYQGAPLQHPIHAILDSDGHIVVADFGTNASGLGTGQLIKIFLCSSLAPRIIATDLNVPNGLTRTKSGRIFITNAIPNGILQYAEPQVLAATSGLGQLQTFPGSFNQPVHMGLDAAGNMFVTENIGRISRVSNFGELPIPLGSSAQLAVGTLSATQFTFPEAAVNNGTIIKKDTLGISCSSFSNIDTLQRGVHYNVTNVPQGLTLVLKRTTSGKVQLSFVGAALAHESANNTTATIQFLNPAITSGNGSQLPAVRIAITFLNSQASAVYSGTTFPEATANDGTVTTTQTITLTNEQWTPAVGLNTVLVAGSHYTATGVPVGLLLRITKISATMATISFTGSAYAHQNANDSVVTLTFTPQALASLTPTDQVVGLNRALTVDFRDNALAYYSGTSFVESSANDGTVSITRTITLAFDTFVPTGVFTKGVHFTATGVPAGLTMTITRTSQTVAQIAFTGRAIANENINDAAITLTFLDAAVMSGKASAVIGLTPKVLTIDFADSPVYGSAVYSDSTFKESAINNGSVNTVSTVTIYGGDSFAGVGPLVQGTYFTASGVPPGLTLNVTRTSSSTAQLSFSGTALAHTNADDAEVILTFLNTAVISGNVVGITGLSPKRLFVDFADPTCGAVTTFAGNANANVVNGVGIMASFADPRDIVTDAAGNAYVAEQYCIRKITPSGMVSTLAGKHAVLGWQDGIGENAGFADIQGIGIDAAGNIYVADAGNYRICIVSPTGLVSSICRLNLDPYKNGPLATAGFNQPHDVAVDAKGDIYVADFGNNVIRKISGGIVSTYSTSTFPNNGPHSIAVDALSGNVYVAGYAVNKVFKVSTNGTVSVLAGSGVLGNVNGTGLSASFGQTTGLTIDTQGNLYVADYYPYSLIRKITPTGVVSTIAGKGTSGYLDGVGTSAAFNYPVGLALDASGNLFIADRFNQRIRTVYLCGASGQFPLAATYSGTVFTESAANNGTITTTQTVTLGGTTWSGAIPDGGTFVPGTHYNVSGVPAGLTFSLVRNSPTTAQLYLTGVAAAHENVNDTSFTLTFLNASVTNGNVSAVVGLTPKTFTIDFNDAPQGAFAAYSDSVFTETAANAGQVTTTRTVTLSGASFATGAYTNGTHFTATGVPAGLTLTVTRLTSTQARLAFTGTAAAHALANSTDVGLTFLPAVLTGGNVAGVVGLTPKTLRVNFLDPYTASYSDTTFAESIANDGTVPTVRTLTLVGVNFTTTATTLVQGTHFNVSGVPAGLTLTVTKTSSNVAQIAFSGAAAAHVIDVNNITLSFLNAALESGSGTAAAVIGLTPKKLSIDFIAPYTATYSAKNFVEGPANDGTVPTVRTLTLFGGDSFLPATLLQGAHFTATGVPAGLTMVMTRTSSTTAQISFTGTATNHANVNDASVSITFIPEALASGNPSAVVGLTPATLTIDFRDPDVTPPSSPNILGFTPQVGTTGTVVTISGFGFTGTQNVLFGGAPAKSFTVVSDSTITAVVDYGSTGDVTVVNAQGFAILPGFTYVPRPVINSFTPTTGNAGAVVSITGSNFQGTALNGTSWTTTSVYFGGTPATSFTVISATQIQATVGAGATGAVRVETLPGNVGVRNGFCYMAPLITAFAPTSASTGTQVVITGSNFTGATAVKFNGKAAASFVVVSDTEITAFPATGTPLTGSISVTTPQCTDDLATFTFIPAPIIYGFWLSGGTDGDVITIDGVNFTGASGVKFGDTVAASYTVVSPTRIQAVVGSGKTGAVSVIGPGGVGSRSKFIYYAPGAGRPNPPIITSFTPTEGPDGTVVTINGLNFQGADWYTTAVRIGDAPDGPKTAIIQSMTATKLVVKVNGGATGLIRVYTPAGVTTSTQTFTYFPPPTISAFTPTTGAAGTTVTILGTEFTGVTSVKFGGVNATSFTVDSPTQITATVGTGNTGKIQVVASGGTATSSVNFTLPTPPPAPTVTTFSPAIATTGTVITINGTNFTGTTQVTFGGTPAQTFTVVNASRITAVVGGGASGSVAVTTPSGSASKTGFTYLPKPLPTITSFAPASASPGQTVTILGTYFTGATQVFMGSASVPFTFIHSGKITVEVPTNAASGVIRVVTPDGVALRSGFTFIPLVAMLDNFGGAHLTSAPPSEPLILAERSETAESVSLGVYPNPATDVVTLTATGFGDGRMVNITILNALGQTILTLNKESIGGNLQTRVDVRDVASGAYTAVLSDGAVRHVVRFVKR